MYAGHPGRLDGQRASWRWYDCPMRRLILFVLVLLVPLRVLGADLMALHMLETLDGQTRSAGVADEATSAMPPDCPMLAKTGTAPESDVQDKSNCLTCQLCMPLAAPAPVGSGPSSALHFAVSSPSFLDFRNADIARALKPPIS
jgi:hypothetical protein